METKTYNEAVAYVRRRVEEETSRLRRAYEEAMDGYKRAVRDSFDPSNPLDALVAQTVEYATDKGAPALLIPDYVRDVIRAAADARVNTTKDGLVQTGGITWHGDASGVDHFSEQVSDALKKANCAYFDLWNYEQKQTVKKL